MRPRDARCPNAVKAPVSQQAACPDGTKRLTPQLPFSSCCAHLFHIPTGHEVVPRLWCALPQKYPIYFWWGSVTDHLPGVYLGLTQASQPTYPGFAHPTASPSPPSHTSYPGFPPTHSQLHHPPTRRFPPHTHRQLPHTPPTRGFLPHTQNHKVHQLPHTTYPGFPTAQT